MSSVSIASPVESLRILYEPQMGQQLASELSPCVVDVRKTDRTRI